MTDSTFWPSVDLVASNVDTSYLAYLRDVARPLHHFSSGQFPSGAVSTPHGHPCVALHGCLDGPITLVGNQWRRTLEVGQVYLLPPNEIHHWENATHQTAATIGVLIDTSSPGVWPDSFGVVEACRQLDRTVTGPLYVDTNRDVTLRQLFWQTADCLLSETETATVTRNGILWSLIGRMLDLHRHDTGQAPTHGDAAQRIRCLLMSRVNESLTVPEIAEAVNMSVTQAKRVFSQAYGCGIKTFLNQQKLYQAKRLLAQQEVTIDEVRRKLGFTSQSYFCRVFREKTGESPSEFRARLRGDSTPSTGDSPNFLFESLDSNKGEL